jgi:hypothetical protein
VKLNLLSLYELNFFPINKPELRNPHCSCQYLVEVAHNSGWRKQMLEEHDSYCYMPGFFNRVSNYKVFELYSSIGAQCIQYM